MEPAGLFRAPVNVLLDERAIGGCRVPAFDPLRTLAGEDKLQACGASALASSLCFQ